MAKKKDKTPDLPAMEGPGVGAPKIEELDKAIDKYVVVRDRRMAESPREKAAKVVVIDLLVLNKDKIGVDSNGEIVYRHGGEVVTLKPGEPKLSIRIVPEAE